MTGNKHSRLQSLNRRIKNRIDLSRLTVLICVICAIWHVYNIHYWNLPNRVIIWDVISYYSYLPSSVIYKDLKLKFIDEDPEYFSDKFWPNVTPDGQYVIKMSMGLSYMYAPFFLIAHASTSINQHDSDGFSTPYKYALIMGGIIYMIIGLLFLRKILLRYFNQGITSLTLITVFFGTHLFYYSSTEAPMPHVFNFALFNVFIYLSLAWHEKPTVIKSLFIGILTGLITLIRPTNILILLFFILWNVQNLNDLKNRMTVFLQAYKHIFVIVSIAFLIWVPQLLYWKYVTGQWLFFPYIGERFFFSHPNIINGLFSFRNSWFTYTPVMIFSIIGIPFLWHQRKEYFWPVLIFTVLNIYFVYSWWCWWYGGSFGSRPMIDSYGLLSIPLAIWLQWLFSRKKWIMISLLSLFLLIGIRSGFHTLQYYYGAIHWDGMTYSAFKKSFFKIKKYDELEKLIRRPDYEKAMKGEEDFFITY